MYVGGWVTYILKSIVTLHRCQPFVCVWSVFHFLTLRLSLSLPYRSGFKRKCSDETPSKTNYNLSIRDPEIFSPY